MSPSEYGSVLPVMTKRGKNWRPGGLLCMLLLLLLLATGEVTAIDVTAEPSPSPADADITEATATPTAPGDDPLREHLSLIIGVSIGIGLCILFAIGCFIWLGVSALREYRNTRPSSIRGTASTNLTGGGGQLDTLQRSTLPRTADRYKEDGNHVTTAT